jgi:peptidyl-prolyl cis-trans isomerase A (cyclophilin A)
MRILLVPAAIAAMLVPVHSLAQTAVMDTSMGRLTCHLFADQKPLTTAAFIGFAKNAAYDGTTLRGSSGTITGGMDVKGSAVAEKPLESPQDRAFDAPGLLAMMGSSGKMSPRFAVLDHANTESDSPNRVVFGLCDAASVRVVQEASHRMMSADNDPAAALKLLEVTIVEDGGTPPPVPVLLVPPAIPQAKLQGQEPTGPTAVFHTTMGNLTCKLFAKESPIAVQTFIGLANGTKDWTNPETHAKQHGVRFYDGMIFDRVLPDFVIQTGDITNDISGKTDIGFRFPNERTPGLTYDRPGRLAFGNGGKDTNNSELFFAEHPMHRLDDGFTIIGQCDEASIKRMEAIARVPRDEHNRPLTPVVIRSVTIK